MSHKNIIKNNQNHNCHDNINKFDFKDLKNNVEYLSELSNQNILLPNSSFNNLLIFSDEYNKINELSTMLDNLFESNRSVIINTNLENTNLNNIIQVNFNYIYSKELERGNIEYKRSLESYNQNDKINKLIRQIHWRIYEGVVNLDKECCYYIIGIEDSGYPSFLTQEELNNSLHFILKCTENTEITHSYLFVKNTIMNYDYIIIKFWPAQSNFIDYF